MGAPPTDEAAMAAALVAARDGRRGANPLVGAAIRAADGRTVTGRHLGAGTAHAEVDAIAAARGAGLDLTTSALFVTLEPCSHTGRTGPCTETIRDAGIPEVVFALPDTTEAGGGGQILAEAGVRVRSGLRAEESAELNARWHRATAERRPFVTAKIAQSLDGKVAAADRTSQWITSAASRIHAHSLRGEVDAILIGTGTVSDDDPRLSARGEDGELLDSQPVPVVLGFSDLPAGSTLAANPATVHLRTHDVTAALRELHDRGVRHLLVEGGPRVLGAFFAADAVDEVLCYQAPVLLGPGLPSIAGLDIATLAEAVGLVPDDTDIPAVARLGPDVLLHFTTGGR